MAPNLLIVIAALVLLPVLLLYEKMGEKRGVLPVKTAVSVLFVITAFVQPHPKPLYFYLLFPGLLLCLGGDVFLALSQKRMFLFGLPLYYAGQFLLAFSVGQVG